MRRGALALLAVVAILGVLACGVGSTTTVREADFRHELRIPPLADSTVVGGVRTFQLSAQEGTTRFGNPGEATAADLEGLGEIVRQDVFSKTGVQLSWEIKRIGRPG